MVAGLVHEVVAVDGVAAAGGALRHALPEPDEEVREAAVVEDAAVLAPGDGVALRGAAPAAGDEVGVQHDLHPVRGGLCERFLHGVERPGGVRAERPRVAFEVGDVRPAPHGHLVADERGPPVLERLPVVPAAHAAHNRAAHEGHPRDPLRVFHDVVAVARLCEGLRLADADRREVAPGPSARALEADPEDGPAALLLEPVGEHDVGGTEVAPDAGGGRPRHAATARRRVDVADGDPEARAACPGDALGGDRGGNLEGPPVVARKVDVRLGPAVAGLGKRDLQDAALDPGVAAGPPRQPRDALPDEGRRQGRAFARSGGACPRPCRHGGRKGNRESGEQKRREDGGRRGRGAPLPSRARPVPGGYAWWCEIHA